MDSALTTVGLPLALAIIMFGLGLDLTIGDFKRVGRAPKAVAVALACQILLLPAICFGLVVLFDLPALLGIGMMLLAASPGGTTANLFSHLFRGDVALNITLTAINTVIAVVTLPVITGLAIAYYDRQDDVTMPLVEIVKVFALILLPVGIGMLLLAASPGGTTANLFSHLFRGDVALNITLTAINTVIAVVTLPVITGLAIAYYDRQDDVSMPLVEIVKVFALILLPVGIGMLVNASAAGFARRMDKPVRIGSAIILAILVLGILLDQRENVSDYLADVGLITALFCAISLVVGYYVPKAFGVTGPQAIASSMEVGVHNATLAIFVAVEVLDEVEISVPAAVYSLVMFLFAALWGAWVSKRVSAREDVSVA